MANYKKLTDVEVMEEVSENSMALVNENGVLKQVPCGAGFGGGGYFKVYKLNQMFYSDIAYNDLKQMCDENSVIFGVYTDYDNLRDNYYAPLLYLAELNLIHEDYIQLSFCAPMGLSVTLNFYPDGTIEQYVNSPV